MMIISFNAFCQDEFELIFLDSIDIPKDKLYAKARSYTAYAFKNSQAVIQMDDQDVGRIIGKGTFSIFIKYALSGYPNVVNFTFTIDVRDNKYRMILNNVYHNGVSTTAGHVGGDLNDEKPDCGYGQLPKKIWESLKIETKNEMERFVKEFGVYMKKSDQIDDFFE